MSILYGSQYVDEKYSSIVEPNLFADTVVLPGILYTDKYEIGPAGQIFIHKVAKGDAVVPAAPGSDFTNEAVSDSLIAIQLNNNFQKSKKIYGVQANAVAFDIAEENLSTALAMVREGLQYSALACLAHEGTADTDSTAITTGAGAVAKLINLRKQIKDAHGKANYALVNTNVYALLLGELGLKSFADPAIVSAELIKRFGLNIIECNAFDNATAKYIDYSATTQTVDLTDVEMIVGYNEAFSIVNNLDALRIHDSEHFIGSLAQVEMNVGFRVTSADQVIVKKA